MLYDVWLHITTNLRHVQSTHSEEDAEKNETQHLCLVLSYIQRNPVDDNLIITLKSLMGRAWVYRIYTSIIFHGSLLHVLFNMMALVPLGSELERVMGSVRLLYMIILLFQYRSNISTISNVTFNDTVRYAWILLVVFQLLMTNVSLLGHLCGILSGFAYTYGLFNFLLPGSSFYSSIESSSWLRGGYVRVASGSERITKPTVLTTSKSQKKLAKSACVRRPKFILCTGGNPSGHIPTHLNQYTTSRLAIWRYMEAAFFMDATKGDICSGPRSAEDSNMFPGRGRTLGSGRSQTVSTVSSDSSLEARLLDNGGSPNHPPATGADQQIVNGRQSAFDGATAAAAGVLAHHQGSVVSEEEIQNLVAMGFERTQVEVAVAAADGDLNVAVEILMSQLVGKILKDCSTICIGNPMSWKYYVFHVVSSARGR
ncbi:unnamed protein product [Camellia sinensis]